MKRKRLLWQLFPIYIALTVLSVVAVGWLSVRSFRAFYLEQIATDLETRTRFLIPRITTKLKAKRPNALQSTVDHFSTIAQARVTVIDLGGSVLADSAAEVSRMDNHAGRPEIAQALQGHAAHSVRYSQTVGADLMYVALPLNDRSGNTLAVVRTAFPLTYIENNIVSLKRDIAAGAILVALCAALISLIVSRRITQPIEVMRDGATKFADGDLSFRIRLPKAVELAQLSHALNSMASSLGDRLKSIMQQRNELDAVLASMAEGVIAIDTQENIIRINHSFARLFSLPDANITGMSIQEAVRNTYFQNLVREALKTATPLEREFTVEGTTAVHLQASTTPLQDSEGNNIGVLLVFHDISNQRQAELMRRDFVANVSHELRTPITAIKGFVETLQDGALKEPDTAQKFLGIISRQTARLSAIIDDLLTLSRIENEQSDALEKSPTKIREVLESAVQMCEHRAAAQSASIEIDCDPELSVNANAALLEQAVLNLVDNAVKYTPQNTRVNIRAGTSDSRLTIAVQDQGNGIEPAHTSRLFERFYRVDEGRVREQGGTGLGLAIVKHIAQAHGGRATVESTPGSGSTFSIVLPNR